MLVYLILTCVYPNYKCLNVYNVFLLLTRVSFLLSTEDSFEVKVANGSILRTQGSCHAVSLKIQGNYFKMDLNVLALGGCDVVLGTC